MNLKFEDLTPVLDPFTLVEIIENGGFEIFRGRLKDCKHLVKSVRKILPASTSRETYLEIYVY